MINKESWSLLVFLVCLAVPSIAQRYYVNPFATGQNTGQNWDNAFTTLEEALYVANPGDEIWVATGIYYPSSAGDRKVRFQLKSGVRLYGGFTGDETALNERDINQFTSIVDGDIGTPGNSMDNSYTLFYLHEPDSTTLIDGFTFRNAMANNPGAANGMPEASGGAMYIMASDAAAFPTIRNCIFEHNTARSHGGAVYINASGNGSAAPLFEKCKFLFNRSISGDGGAIYRNGGSWIDRTEDISGCVFKENKAFQQGGAIFFSDSQRSDTFDITHTILQGNQVEQENPGIVQGDAIQIANPRFDGNTTLSLKNSQIIGHSGECAIGLDIGFGFLSGNLFLDIDSSQFESNHATAQIDMLGWSKICIRNTTFFRDTFGIRCSDSGNASVNALLKNVTLRECHNFQFDLLSENIEAENLIWSKCTAQNLIKGSIFGPKKFQLRNFILHNTYFVLSGQSTSTVQFSNSTVYSKTNDRIEISGSNLEISNNIFYTASKMNLLNLYLGNSAGSAIFSHNILSIPDTFNTGNWIKTGNQWNTDPLLYQPDSSDFSLQPCSPAINSGNNNTSISQQDVLNGPRLRFGTVDIGAVEMGDLSFLSPPSIQPSCQDDNTGSADLSGINACIPIQYAWSNASGINTPFQNNLAAGMYTVSITDGKGRMLVSVLQISTAPQPQLTFITLPVSCGDTIGGSATLEVSSSPGPYQFSWTNGSTDSLRTGLAAGAYPVTVTDANGCTAEGAVEVEPTGNLSIDIELGAISCHGAADGSFTVLPADGKPPFTWHWENGANTPTLAPLGPGAYLGTLTDALGCSIGWILPLGEPGPLALHPQVTPASDSVLADGRIELMPTGGTGPFQALWSTGATGLSVDSLAAGFYSVTLTDAHDCTATETIPVGVSSDTGEAPGAGSAFSLFPNPAISLITVALEQPAARERRLQLRTIAGQLLYETTVLPGQQSINFQVNNWARGMYVVQLDGRAQKLVLQ